jgi:hypothetical protein
VNSSSNLNKWQKQLAQEWLSIQEDMRTLSQQSKAMSVVPVYLYLYQRGEVGSTTLRWRERNAPAHYINIELLLQYQVHQSSALQDWISELHESAMLLNMRGKLVRQGLRELKQTMIEMSRLNYHQYSA